MLPHDTAQYGMWGGKGGREGGGKGGGGREEGRGEGGREEGGGREAERKGAEERRKKDKVREEERKRKGGDILSLEDAVFPPRWKKAPFPDHFLSQTIGVCPQETASMAACVLLPANYRKKGVFDWVDNSTHIRVRPKNVW